jgi:hypothetical protein
LLKVGSVVAQILESVAREVHSGLSVQALARSVSYAPKRNCHLSIVLGMPIPQEAVRRIQRTEFVDAAEIEGNYLNLRLRPSIRVMMVEPTPRPQPSVVEHTSMAPAYPINIATLRSSIIGEWIRRALKRLGAPVEARYWVQDSARQVELLDAARPWPFGGKGDHAAGASFAHALLQRHGQLASEAMSAAAALFPFAIRSNNLESATDYVKETIAGWSGTLTECGVHVDQFDRDSEFLDALPWRELVNHAALVSGTRVELRDGGPAGQSLSYLARSALYYAYLLTADGAAVYSVIPLRQRDIQESARDYACEWTGRAKEDLRLIYYADVYVDGELDSIRGGRFRSVDETVLRVPLGISRLVDAFIGARSSSVLHIDSSLPERRHPDAYVGDPSVQAVLLLDELPLLLAEATDTGDFAKVRHWADRASSTVAAADNLGAPSDIIQQLTVDIRQFSGSTIGPGGS